MNEKDPSRYDDIIGLPHFVSRNRRHMSNADRAAQFSPFDALTGYDEAIEETGRTTEEEIVLGESEIRILDRRFRIIRDHLSEMPEISICYFEPDLYKEGGRYLEENIRVRRIDLQQRILQSADRKNYDLDAIVAVNGSFFDGYEF